MSRKSAPRKRPCSRMLDDEGVNRFDNLNEELYAKRVASLQRFKESFSNIIDKFSGLATPSEGESREVTETRDLGETGKAYNVSVEAINNDTSWRSKDYVIDCDLDVLSLEDEAAPRHIVPDNSARSSVRFNDDTFDHLFQVPRGKLDPTKPRTTKFVHGKRWSITPKKNRDFRTVKSGKITKERDRDDVLSNGDNKDCHFNSPESRGTIQNTGTKPESSTSEGDKQQGLMDESFYDDINNDIILLLEDDSDEDDENVFGSVVAPKRAHSTSDDEYQNACSSISR